MDAPTLHVVVEGIGNVVQTYYAKALQRSLNEHPTNLKITFVDEASHWQGQSNSTEFTNFITNVLSWGANYIDKSVEPGKSQYAALSADVVLIATPDYTHVNLAKHWLKRDRCSQIFIEKPIDESLSKARDLLGIIRENDPKVRALDHYRARMLPIINSPLQLKAIRKGLGDRITGFTFYFLEDGSLFKDDSGDWYTDDPIERVGRSKSLQSGLILDMMPHVPAVLASFGIVDSIRVLGVKIGRYTYTDKHGDTKEASIAKETFAHVRFSFRGFDFLPIKGDVYLGKGIRGSRDLEKEGDIKLLDLIGQNGKRFRFDLRGSTDGGDVVLIDKKKNEQRLITLWPDAYGTIIRIIIEQKLTRPNLQLLFDMPIELAKNIRLAIDEMLHPIRYESMPSYHISAPVSGKSGAPYLEDLVESLEPAQVFL